MDIRKTELKGNEQLFFEMDNGAFTRDYDLKARTIEEESEYLKHSEIYITYEGDIPIGFFAYETRKEYVEVKTVVVIPSYQGKGYGTSMMRKLRSIAEGTPIHLVTHPRNTCAIILYLKSGFSIVGWKDNYYGDGQPRLLLQTT